MTVIKKTIGRLPVNLGDYDSTKAYGKRFRCNLYGCEWESKIDNNTFAPAKLVNGVVTPDTTHWSLVSGIPANYDLNNKIVDQQNQINTLKGGSNKSIATIDNEKVAKEAGKGLSTNDYTNEEKSKLDGLPSGSELSSSLNSKANQNNTYTKDEVNGLITTPDQQYVTVEATSSTRTATDVLPATGAADTVYRVGSWNGSAYDEGCYTEYTWDSANNRYLKLSVKQVGMDNVPTYNSRKQISSDAVFRATTTYQFVGTGIENLFTVSKSGNTVVVTINSGFQITGTKIENNINIGRGALNPDYIGQSFTLLPLEGIGLIPDDDYTTTYKLKPVKFNYDLLTSGRTYNGKPFIPLIYSAYGLIKSDIPQIQNIIDTQLPGYLIHDRIVNNDGKKFTLNQNVTTIASGLKAGDKVLAIVEDSGDFDSDINMTISPSTNWGFAAKYIIASGKNWKSALLTVPQGSSAVYALFASSVTEVNLRVYVNVNAMSIYQKYGLQELIADNWTNKIDTGITLNNSAVQLWRAGEPTAQIEKVEVRDGVLNTFFHEKVTFPDTAGWVAMRLFVKPGKKYALSVFSEFTETNDNRGNHGLRALYALYGSTRLKIIRDSSLVKGRDVVIFTAPENYFEELYLQIQFRREYTAGTTIFKDIRLHELLEVEEYGRVGNFIQLSPDGTMYQIRNTINSIEDASESNPYTILLTGGGTFKDFDIHTKDYVDIIGLDAVIECDGNWTDNAPSDYTYRAGYAGVPINTIPRAWKHLFIHMSNSTIKGVKMIVNNVKYAIHQDNGSAKYTAIVRNCTFVTNDGIPLVGIGALGDQNQKFIDCDFIHSIGEPTGATTMERVGIFKHNWNNQASPTSMLIENCRFHSSHIVSLYDLGSTQEDSVVVRNCQVDDSYGVFYGITKGYYKVNGAVSDDVPYNIHLRIENTDCPIIVDPDRASLAASRIHVKGNKFISYHHNATTFGVAVSTLKTGALTTPNTGEEYGVCIGNGYITMGNVAMVYCPGGASAGDKLYMNDDGTFSKTSGILAGECVYVYGNYVVMRKYNTTANTVQFPFLPPETYSKNPLLEGSRLFERMRDHSRDLTIVHLGDSIGTNGGYSEVLSDKEAAYLPPRMDEKYLSYYIEKLLKWAGQEYRRSDAKVSKDSNSPMFTEVGTGVNKYYDAAWDWQYGASDSDQGTNWYKLWTRVLTGTASRPASVTFTIPKGVKTLAFIYRTDYLCSESCTVSVDKSGVRLRNTSGNLVDANDYTFSMKEPDEVLTKTIDISNGTTQTRTMRKSRGQVRLVFHVDDMTKEYSVAIACNGAGRLNYWGVEYTAAETMIRYINMARGGHNLSALSAFEEWDVDGFKPDVILLQCPIINEGALSNLDPHTPNTPTVFANRIKQYLDNLVSKEYSPEVIPYTLYIGSQAGIVNPSTGKHGYTYADFGYTDVYSYVNKLHESLAGEYKYMDFFMAFDKYADLLTEMSGTDNKYIAAIKGSGNKGNTLTQDNVHLNLHGTLFAYRLLKEYLQC